MAETITINDKQKDTLKDVVKAGRAIVEGNFDKRTINALEVRGLVKKSENKKGIFVAPTAKGKKFLN